MHGGGLYNLVFMPRESVVLEVTHDRGLRSVANLAHSAGLHHLDYVLSDASEIEWYEPRKGGAQMAVCDTMSHAAAQETTICSAVRYFRIRLELPRFAEVFRRAWSMAVVAPALVWRW